MIEAMLFPRSKDRGPIEAGTFDFQLHFTGKDAPPSDDPGLPSLITALGDAGLKLERAKGPVEFLVIDRGERPSEN